VQRLGAGLLRNWGQVVRIHIRGSTTDSLLINNMYISRVARPGDPANPAPDAYDAHSDLALVASGVAVPSGASIAVAVNGNFSIPDPLEDILIAFDIAQGQGQARQVTLSGANAFVGRGTQQASEQNRFPNPTDPARTYNNQPNRLYLIEKIEVA
jgi:hypothetical protein